MRSQRCGRKSPGVAHWMLQLLYQSRRKPEEVGRGRCHDPSRCACCDTRHRGRPAQRGLGTRPALDHTRPTRRYNTRVPHEWYDSSMTLTHKSPSLGLRIMKLYRTEVWPRMHI